MHRKKRRNDGETVKLLQREMKEEQGFPISYGGTTEEIERFNSFRLVNELSNSWSDRAHPQSLRQRGLIITFLSPSA